jgi:ubiquinone biosynthesis protein
VPTDAIAAIVKQELGRDPGVVFAEFEPTPLAAASIGQVHGATLHDGSPVVVKVRKPGVAETVADDLAILEDLARRAARADLLGPGYDVEALADDFAWTLHAELDYLREGRNADRLRVILAEEPRAVVPAVHWRWTTGGLLVVDRLEGTRIDDLAALDAKGIARPALAQASTEVLMRQVFGAGFFHADPHPGSFLVLDDGRIGLLDFGMVGHIDEQMRRALVTLLAATVRQDAAGMAGAFERLGILRAPEAQDGVRRDLGRLLDRYQGRSLDEIRLGDYVHDLLGVIRRHRLQLPTDLAVLLKTIAMSEGLWQRLDPSFNAGQVAERFVGPAGAQIEAGRRLLRSAGGLIGLGSDLPGTLWRLLERLERSELELALRRRDLDELAERSRGAAGRLAVAVIAAGFVVGLPVVALTWRPPGWGVVAPVWFTIGTVVTLALFARLLVEAWRGRR